jgi:hypothetical protein
MGAYGVEERQVPVLGEILPGDGVGLTADGQDSLDGDVHDHETLGTESVRQDLERVGYEKTRPRK